jgi:hypothetical protein
MQSADVRPEPSTERKARIAHAGARDHAGELEVVAIPDFDLNRTIFKTLEGKLARYVQRKRVGKEPRWFADAAERVQQAYDEARPDLPPIAPELLSFMVDECDFDVEHADGSFLDHLYFCYEYGHLHYPQHSAIVLLLHSILGTGTNTFAMTADRIPALRELMTPFEWRQTEAFPSVLRLLYHGPIRDELRENLGRADAIQSVQMRRVIDNAPIELSGEDFWIALNYQLIHLVDFMPVANWAAHLNDTSFILFRDLYDLLQRAGKLEAKVTYTPPSGPATREGEPKSFGHWLEAKIPVSLSAKMASKSVAQFSDAIGHSLDYTIVWG